MEINLKQPPFFGRIKRCRKGRGMTKTPNLTWEFAGFLNHQLSVPKDPDMPEERDYPEISYDLGMGCFDHQSSSKNGSGFLGSSMTCYRGMIIQVGGGGFHRSLMMNLSPFLPWPLATRKKRKFKKKVHPGRISTSSFNP